MDYKFRTDSIHSEVRFIAGEFEKALAPNKNDYAAFLLWFMEEYPNCKPESVFGMVKKNFLDTNLPGPVRRKFAKMLGEIGANHFEEKTTSQMLELILNGMKDNDPHMACECMDSLARMADARRWQDFDHMIMPLLERIVDVGGPNEQPNILDSALNALSQIKPNRPEFLDDIDEVKAELGRKKRDPRKGDGWDEKIRKLEKIRQEWKSLLIQRGKWEEKKVSLPAPKANGAQQSNSGARGRRRRIVTP
jgi:hypothetical protein